MIARRRMLEIAAGSAAVFSLGSAGRAAALPRTPPQTAGPFYPLSIPADSDNDLVRLAGFENERVAGLDLRHSTRIAHHAGAGDDVIEFPLRAVRMIRVRRLSRRHAANLHVKRMPLV